MPEVSLVAMLDADKEGFLRSETSLIQTIGRAARNAEGLVILYADTVTPSMRAAMDETERRRNIQDAYNKAHGIVPKTIIKDVREILEISKSEDTGHKAKGKRQKADGRGADGGDRQAGAGDEGGQPSCWNSSTPPCCVTASSSCGAANSGQISRENAPRPKTSRIKQSEKYRRYIWKNALFCKRSS